ncbi:MAG: hypothetical protein E7576_00890 [Ruminococcaceae bacterium]|jgi:hypothetical protein|nr:hypothetical protein [Oscillospiraceae bacterium]
MIEEMRSVSFTGLPTPEASLSDNARWLWLDQEKHPGTDVTPTTVFAAPPEGFRFTTVEFEKTVTRRSPAPDVFRVTVFADPKFRLYVNDRYVGTGPCAAGGDYANTLPMPKQYVNRYDVPVEGRMLKIRAEVWNGCGVMTDYSTGFCAFILSGEIDGTEIVTDASWRVRVLPGCRGISDTDLTAAPGEWEVPAVLEDGPWNPADPRLPALSEETVQPETIRRDVLAGEQTLRVSFDRIYSAYLCLSVKNAAGRAANVRIGVAEGNPGDVGTSSVTVPASDGATSYREKRMLSIGAVMIKAPADVEVSVSLAYAHYPVDRDNEGYFRCPDEKLNQIYHVGKFTLEMCRQSLHLDSPLHQETLGCTGDYAIEALMTRTTFGDMRLTRADLIRTADYLVMTNGYMFHTAYSLIWVTMLRDYVRWTGDRETLKACRPALDILLNRFRGYIGDSGVIENPPNYMFVDWANIDGFQLHHPPMALGQTALNAFWQGALKAASELYRSGGSAALAREVKDEAERHRGAAVREFYDFERELFFDGWSKSRKDPEQQPWQPENPDKRYYSKHSNTLAVLFGLVEGRTAKTLAERILTEDWLDEGSKIEVQPYFMHYVCEMAVKTGLWKKYGIGLMHLWDKQVEESPKGMKEGWGDFHGDCSHAWGATPVYQMPVRLLGFEMLKSGFRKFRIKPELCGLDWVEAGIPTPWGLLRIRANAHGISADVPDVFVRAESGRGGGAVFELKAD